MREKNVSPKTESVRLGGADKAWLDEWTRQHSQDRSGVIRAAVRFLRIATEGMDPYARVRFVADLSSTRDDPVNDEARVMAAMAAQAVGRAKTRRGKA